MFGKLLLERLHPVLYKLSGTRTAYQRRNLRTVRKMQQERARKKRLNEVEEEKQLILAALQRYESKGTDRLA